MVSCCFKYLAGLSVDLGPVRSLGWSRGMVRVRGPRPWEQGLQFCVLNESHSWCMCVFMCVCVCVHAQAHTLATECLNFCVSS